MAFFLILLPIIQIWAQSYSFYSESEYIHNELIGLDESIYWAYVIALVLEISKFIFIMVAINSFLEHNLNWLMVFLMLICQSASVKGMQAIPLGNS